MIDFPLDNHKNIHLSPEAFKKMKRLRFFKCYNVHFSGDHLDYLPHGIKVLEWPECPLQFMPPTFRGDKLVILRMPQSLMREISLEYKNLTVMDFERCKFLTKISDLSGCPNLKDIYISACRNLVEVHDSIGLLDQLVEFEFELCDNLKSFPKIFRLRSLECLIGRDSGLQKFPEIECEMEHLSFIDLSNSDIEELPSSIGYLIGLTDLILSDYANLKRLPSGFSRLRSLTHLELRNCPIISFGMEEEVNNGQLPNIMSTREIEGSSSEELFPLQTPTKSAIPLQSLDCLDLSGSDIQSIPAIFKSYVRLRYLYLDDCKQLKEIIEFPPNVEKVSAPGCISLDSLPEISRAFTLSRNTYQEINLSGCYKLNMEGNCMPNPTWPTCMMMFPGNKIPEGFNYCKEASNSHWCEFDIQVHPPYSDDIVKIAFCAVIQPHRTSLIKKQVGDRTDHFCMYKMCGRASTGFYHEDLYDHVWLGCMDRELTEFGQDVDNLRITFESTPNSVIFKRCGVHLVYKNHEQNEKDLEGIGNLANPMEGGQLSKRRGVDSDHYDGDNHDACNIASNLSTQQMKTSPTLAIRIC